MKTLRQFLEETEPPVRVLYNASTADRDHDGWLEPHISGWVKEIAHGAVDGPISDYVKPLVYMSSSPDWTHMIVGRHIGKHPTEVTDDDIRQHGRLNIIHADPEHDPVYQVGDYSHDQKVTKLSGERIHFHASELHDHEDFPEMPIGPEPNDFISREPMQIHQSLTGDALVNFLKANRPK